MEAFDRVSLQIIIREINISSRASNSYRSDSMIAGRRFLLRIPDLSSEVETGTTLFLRVPDFSNEVEIGTNVFACSDIV